MLPYIKIAETLDTVSKGASKVEKVDAVAELLKNHQLEMLRPMTRLLQGTLWPSWEMREMGVGPKVLQDVLENLYGQNLEIVGQGVGADNLTKTLRKPPLQHQLSPSKLDALQVYHTFRQISDQRGARSLHRKKALLKSLLLKASPLEAEYIAKTALGKMMAGLGPSLMISAISEAFEVDENLVRNAYARIPELGLVALVAARDEISEVKIAPPTPVIPMVLTSKSAIEDVTMRVPNVAYVVKYGGLRIQVHKVNDRTFFYTSHLKNITKALQDLAEEIAMLAGNLVVEGELLLVQEGELLSFRELVGYINRKQSRMKGDRIQPSLAITDVLYQDGKETLHLGYAERRTILSRLLKDAPRDVFQGGLSLAEETIQGYPGRCDELYCQSLAKGFQGLLMRDLEAPYTPGAQSHRDVVIRKESENFQKLGGNGET